jgi:pimeloyl-ACP methyl ester carboxylesterase
MLFFEGDLPAAAVDAKYSSDSSQFLTLANGTRVHYRDEGNPNGMPVVLIHGAMASLHTWEGWVAALGRALSIGYAGSAGPWTDGSCTRWR